MNRSINMDRTIKRFMKRSFSFFLSFCVVFISCYNVAWADVQETAAEEEAVKYIVDLDQDKLQSAVETAIRGGHMAKSLEEYQFTGDDESTLLEYSLLLASSKANPLYEVNYPFKKGQIPSKTDIHIFVRKAELEEEELDSEDGEDELEITADDSGYQVTGEETLIVLYSNHSKKDVIFSLRIGNCITPEAYIASAVSLKEEMGELKEVQETAVSIEETQPEETEESVEETRLEETEEETDAVQDQEETIGTEESADQDDVTDESEAAEDQNENSEAGEESEEVSEEDNQESEDFDDVSNSEAEDEDSKGDSSSEEITDEGSDGSSGEAEEAGDSEASDDSEEAGDTEQGSGSEESGQSDSQEEADGSDEQSGSEDSEDIGTPVASISRHEAPVVGAAFEEDELEEEEILELEEAEVGMNLNAVLGGKKADAVYVMTSFSLGDIVLQKTYASKITVVNQQTDSSVDGSDAVCDYTLKLSSSDGNEMSEGAFDSEYDEESGIHTINFSLEAGSRITFTNVNPHSVYLLTQKTQEYNNFKSVKEEKEKMNWTVSGESGGGESLGEEFPYGYDDFSGNDAYGSLIERAEALVRAARKCKNDDERKRLLGITSFPNNEEYRKKLVKDYCKYNFEDGTTGWPLAVDEGLGDILEMSKASKLETKDVLTEENAYLNVYIKPGATPQLIPYISKDSGAKLFEGNNNVADKWRAYLVYNYEDGNWYECENGSYADIAYLYSHTVSETLKDRGYEVLKYDPRKEEADLDQAETEGSFIKSGFPCNITVTFTNEYIYTAPAPDDNQGEVPEGGQGENEGETSGDNQGEKPDNNQEVKPDDNQEVKPGDNQEVNPGDNQEVIPDDNQGVSPDDNQEVIPDDNQPASPDSSQESSNGDSNSSSGEDGGSAGSSSGNTSGGSSFGGPGRQDGYVSEGPGAQNRAGETVDIQAEPVPMGAIPVDNVSSAQDLFVVDDGEVPLAALPKTGDSANAKAQTAMILSGILLAFYTAVSRKKETE
ncbi:hypothetical protein C0033_07920 [Clostridium sp. chh4-2]|nr:hypothetical protein C0033_07920 [Clostridium sp. chh4-2]